MKGLLTYLGCVLFVVTLIVNLQSVYSFDAYQPKIIGEMREPPESPTPTTAVEVVIKIHDRYGVITNATLFYSTDNWNSEFVIKAQLIDGTYYNGTFRGIIPRYSEGTTVNYYFYLVDNLGYDLVTDKRQGYTVQKDITPPVIQNVTLDPVQPTHLENVGLIINTRDPNSGIEKIVIQHSANNQTAKQELYPEANNRWYGVFKTVINGYNAGTLVNYTITVYDNSNNYAETNGSYTVEAQPRPKLSFFMQISDVNFKTLRLDSNTHISLEMPSNRTIWPTLKIVNMWNNTIFDQRDSTMKLIDGNFFENSEDTKRMSLHLLGESWNYPFDANTYFINTIAEIPVENVEISSKTLTSIASLESDWRMINPTVKVFNQANYTQIQAEAKFVRQTGVFSYSFFIPVVIMFFVLGVTMLLESKEHLMARITLYIGIFAFLIGYFPLFESFKPSITYGLLTFADYTLLMLAGFTGIFTFISFLSTKMPESSRTLFEFGSLLPVTLGVIIITQLIYPNVPLSYQPIIYFGILYGVSIRFIEWIQKRRIESRTFSWYR